MPGGVVFDQGNVNIAALTAPGGYVQIIPPLGIIIPLPTNAVGYVGSASWGPVNKATASGSINTSISQFGQYDASLADPYDMCRDTLIAFQQAQSAASLTVWQVRITDGTDAQATYALLDTTGGTPLTGMTAKAKWTGIAGNKISVTITAGNLAHSYNVNVVAAYAGLQSEFYQNVPGGSTGSLFWANFISILSGGQSGVRGPSQLLVGTIGNSSAIAPALGTFTLTGGADGRSSLTSASYFGSDTIGNRQGVYALRNLAPTPTMFWCCGLTDTTKIANKQALASQEIMIAMLAFAAGTSTSTAISTKQTLGIDDYRVCFIKDCIYWTDPIGGKQELVSPAAFAGARIATLSPELSPLNVQVFAVNGTERNGPQGNQNYDLDEIGLLNVNGILAITNPVPGGYYWGFPVGNNSSSDPVRAPIEYSRMIDYIGLSLAARIGKFVGKNQRLKDPDPVRQAVKNELDEFGIFLRDIARQIDDFFSVCDISLNTPQTIPRRYLFANFYVRLLSSIQFVVINLQGGTTVSTTPATSPSGTISNS